MSLPALFELVVSIRRKSIPQTDNKTDKELMSYSYAAIDRIVPLMLQEEIVAFLGVFRNRSDSKSGFISYVLDLRPDVWIIVDRKV